MYVRGLMHLVGQLRRSLCRSPGLFALVVLTLTLGVGATIGGAIGIVSALAGRRVLASLLFVTDARNPMTVVGVAALLGSLVLLACYLPARRASRIDPSIVLRGE
jgi:putative ABC transport system permease protein